MPPTARVVAATVVFLGAVCYHQLFATAGGLQHHKHAAVFTPLLAGTRSGLARSEHPELYAPAARLGFVFVTGPNREVRETVLYAIRNTLAPAAVADDPKAGVVVAYFHAAEDVAPFESANRRFRLLDKLGENVRVYRQEGN